MKHLPQLKTLLEGNSSNLQKVCEPRRHLDHRRLGHDRRRSDHRDHHRRGCHVHHDRHDHRLECCDQNAHRNDLVVPLFVTVALPRLIGEADQVISSSPFLNDFCLGLNRRKACTYISSSIDTDRFLPANRYSNDKPVTIGWTGTFSSKMYLDQLRGVFQALARRAPFKLKVIGNFEYELPGVDLEVVQWTSEREVADLQTFDIGVYPLPIDDWVLGKSGLKAIQYMAFGLPTVATEVGTTPLLISSGVNGILVKTDAQWLDALEQLINQPELRRRLGEAARASAVAKYSTKVIAEHYRRVLRAAETENR